MFGLFASKEEKIALRIERLLMTTEMAFNSNKLDVALKAWELLPECYEQLEVLGWADKLEGYLRERGLARLAKDPDYFREVSRAMLIQKDWAK